MNLAGEIMAAASAIIERYKIFLAKDVPRILKEEGLDNISKEDWAKIQPLLGEEQMHATLFKNS